MFLTTCGRGGSLGLQTGLSTVEAGGTGDEGLLLGLDSSLFDGEWALGSGTGWSICIDSSSSRLKSSSSLTL